MEYSSRGGAGELNKCTCACMHVCVHVCTCTHVCAHGMQRVLEHMHLTSLSRPKRTSVLSERSWASSMMMALYWSRSGSLRDSRSRMPSVMYLMIVD